MKRKFLTMAAVCALTFAVTACGSGNGQETTTTAAETTESETAGSASEAETTKPDLSTVDPKEALGPGAFDTDEDSEEMKNYQALLESDYLSFAEQVVEAFEGEDMEAVADLMHYPCYVSCVEENDGIITDREMFLKQDPEKIFNGDLLNSLKEADLEELEPMVVGVEIGNDTSNVIINIRDGELGITGVNY